MLSRNLEQSLHRALALATERNHEYATLEHLLLALIDDQDGISVLRACGVDLEQLKDDLTEFVDQELQNLVTSKLTEPKPTASFRSFDTRSDRTVNSPKTKVRATHRHLRSTPSGIPRVLHSPSI